MKRNSLAHIACCAALCFGAAQAQETVEVALYDRPAPADAVFLRWIGTTDLPESLGLDALPTTLSTTLPATQVVEAGAYHPISARHLKGVEAGGYYTVALNTAQTPILISEPQRGEKSKVHLILLNASPAPVRLVLDGKGVEVIQRTDAFASGGRMVNPVSADLAVLGDDGQRLGTVSASLRRGQNVTILVDATGVRLIENQIGAVMGD